MHAGRAASISPADALVVGAGPNGLAAAIVLAQAGCSVTVIEAEPTIGGACRSAELTLPGFVHDACSAIHPLGAGSPFFRTLPLDRYGLEWVEPDYPLAHPLDDGTAVVLERDLDATAARLGEDGRAYDRLFRPVVETWEAIESAIFGPPLRLPPHPLKTARFGLQLLRSADHVVRKWFRGERARALLAGCAAHSMLPLDAAPSASVGLVLPVAAHRFGWPFPRGGAQCLSDALAAHLQALGGKIVTGFRVTSLADLPPARAVLCDVTPRQLLRIASDRLPGWYRRKLERYRYGMGAFKVDFALDGPIPWRAEECARAGTVHLGGTMEEIARSESATWNGTAAERPFVLLAQQTPFDRTRAPAGKHTVWCYCHVPHASTVDMLPRIEAQIERFAPGFRQLILARSVRPPAALEQHNANLVAGDINGGAMTLSQVLFRPTRSLYRTPLPGLYLCSSSTPPGGGVHGMCGFAAAQLALKQRF